MRHRIRCLPCYVNGLRKAGIQIRALIGALWLPATGAATTWILSAEAAKVVSASFPALVCSGVTALVTIGVLAYRMRGTLALLRQTSSGPISSDTDEAVPELPDLETEVMSELAALSEATCSAQAASHDRPAAMTSAWQHTLPTAFYHDLTGPLDLPRSVSVYRSTLERCSMTGQDMSATSPLYQLTASSLQWNPAKTPHPTQTQNAASCSYSNADCERRARGSSGACAGCASS